MCKANSAKAHEFLYFDANERDCFASCSADGGPALNLVVSEEYFNSKFNELLRTNGLKFMAHVYESKHASE
jgi:hypothetical protein